MRKAISNQDGFTLIETLVALTIFAIGLLGIAGMQAKSISYNAGSNTRTVAAALAQGAMEAILARPADDPVFRSDAADQVFRLNPGDPAVIGIDGGGNYTITWDVDADAPTNRLTQITVEVYGPNRYTADDLRATVTNTIRYAE